MVLYDEDPSDAKGKQYVGSVIWRTEPIKASGSQKPGIAVRADIDIPDRKFKMTMSFRRNTDTSLPASHTAELTFILPQDFASGGVGNVPGILMKSNEQARGTPLAGLAVKVTDGFFLVGLSNVEADRARNLQFLQERSWFDIPLVYVNQRRAIIAIEKGAPGEQAFSAAFSAWGETVATAAPAGSGGYLVQVTSQLNEADAQASYRALQGKFPSVLAAREPVIKRADTGASGVYYRAHVGPFKTSEEASRFCGELKTVGGQCVVQRN